ncbi:MAG TPA: hypothetical protein PLE45_03775 [Spirochaetota bacterium]|nr:hypothetical protein [Spirochaetota bacterium]HOL56347.1 hypothetical protein [Spirochaetota bacterium]HPP03863.1 hypothetical protein [Spirochaetota bacterium]
MKKKYRYIFYSNETILFYIGISFISIFIIVFFVVAAIKGKLDYISFFFHNLKHNIFLSFLTGLHVFILASGILLIFISFFRMSPIVLVYDDRFEIFEFLQRRKIIRYENIKSVKVSINYVKATLFEKERKECRIFINNPDFVFYFCYDVDGYFDDIIIEEKENYNILLRKCKTSKENVKEILKEVVKHSNIKFPFLP